MCEIGMFRSPDGKRIVGLARSQSHNNPSTLIYSDDEGKTWSEPMDLPGTLAGERHKAVYDPIIHGQFDETGVNIGKTDAVRMISNYLSVKLSGNSHEEMRAYAKTTNKLANMLTHKRTASKRDMMLVTSATISLINFIGILEDKY